MAISEAAAFAHLGRQANDRIVLGLPVDLREHDVRLGVGEEAAAFDRGQLRGVAEHQDRLAERQQVASEFGVDHRTFVDHDEAGAGGRPVMVESEFRRAIVRLGGAVDQRVDGGRAGAALGAHHQRRLAGERREGRFAPPALRDVAGERRLADAGVAEQAEHLWFGGAQPLTDPVEGRLLLARPVHASPFVRQASRAMRRRRFETDEQLIYAFRSICNRNNDVEGAPRPVAASMPDLNSPAG